MPESMKTIRVYRDSWMPEHLALLCGIANAGGGVLSVASTSKNYSQGLKRMRKPFEQIPVLAQQELGIICTTQPVLEGPTLCLEIDVPAADPRKPLRYKAAYRFYDNVTEQNLSLSPEEIMERRLGSAGAPAQPAQSQGFDALDAVVAAAETTVSAQAASAPAQEAALNAAPAATPSTSPEDLFQLFAALADRFAQAGGAVSVSQESGSITFSLPQQEEATPTSTQPHETSQLRQADPDAEAFVERSVAAANGFDLTSTDEYILRVLNTNGRATAPRIAEVLGVSESTVRRSFKRLKELQLIVRVGSAKAGYWRVMC